VPFLGKIIACRDHDQHFAWGAWEDEIAVEAHSYMQNLSIDGDGCFDFIVSLADWLFVNGEMCYPNQSISIKLTVQREDIQKLVNDLKKEMGEVPGNS